jgi:hypothetical protein
MTKPLTVALAILSRAWGSRTREFPPAAVAAVAATPISRHWYYYEAAHRHLLYASTCPVGWKALPPGAPPLTQEQEAFYAS